MIAGQPVHGVAQTTRAAQPQPPPPTSSSSNVLTAQEFEDLLQNETPRIISFKSKRFSNNSEQLDEDEVVAETTQDNLTSRNSFHAQLNNNSNTGGSGNIGNPKF